MAKFRPMTAASSMRACFFSALFQYPLKSRQKAVRNARFSFMIVSFAKIKISVNYSRAVCIFNENRSIHHFTIFFTIQSKECYDYCIYVSDDCVTSHDSRRHIENCQEAHHAI